MTSDKEQLDAGQQALGDALAVSFRALRAVMLALLAGYLLSGLFIVHQDERAFTLVFGHVEGDAAHRLKGPGLHWTWPKPIAEVVRLKTERVATLTTTSFWPKEDPLAKDAGAPGPTLKPGADGYTLTGDANLLHSRWAVRYTLSDPETFAFGWRDAAQVLHDEFDRAILATSAQLPVDQALRTNVEGFRSTVEQTLRTRCDALRLGVRVQGVDILGLTPPRQVAEAFNAVVESEQERSRRISEARAYATRQTSEARGQAARTLAEGASAKNKIVSQAKADADYFRKIAAEYAKNPDVILKTLRQDAVRRTLEKVEQKFVVHRDASGQQEIRVMVSPEQPKKR
jgi:membrane protease subunit HflK